MHVGSARKEEAEALREALSSGDWHQHHGGSVAMTDIDRRNRTTRRLDDNVTGSSQRLGWSTLVWGVAKISPAGSTVRSRGRGWVWEGTGRRRGSGA
jgi:hypothetical protein